MVSKPSDEEKVDSKENEKWMDNNDSDKDAETEKKTETSKFCMVRENAKKLASNKYYVVIILLCVLVFVLFILVIAIAVKLNTYVCLEKPVKQCTNSVCLSAAATFVSKANFNSDPCTDFWSYSCGGWLNKNPLPKNKGSYSIEDQMKEKLYERVRKLIDMVPQDADIRTPEYKVNSFYFSCMRVTQFGSGSDSILTRKINEFGGWEILNNWIKSRWSLDDVLANVQVHMGVYPFFRILVEVNDNDPLKHIIKIVPDGLGLPGPRYYLNSLDNEYIFAYKNFISDILRNFNVKLFDAEKFADEMFHFEKRLAVATPSLEDLRSNKFSKVITIQDLNTLCPRIYWIKLLQAHFPNLIHPDTLVAVSSEEYLKHLSRIFSTTDDAVLNNYIIWRLVSAYVEHLSNVHRVALKRLKQTFEGVSKSGQPAEERWEFCIRKTIHYLGHSVTAMYVKNYLTLGTGFEVNIMLHKVLAAFISNINKIPWLEDLSSLEVAREKLNDVSFLVGYPQFIMNQSLLEAYYNEFQVENEHLNNIMNGEFFLKRKQQALLEIRPTNDSRWTIYGVDTEALYSYAGNYLVIPLALMDDSMFAQDLPIPVMLGAVAGHVANKLSQTLDDKGVSYLNGIFYPWLDNTSSNSFSEKQECLKSSIQSYSFKNISIPSELTVGSAISDIGGVKLAYMALKNYLKDTENSSQLPSIDLSSKQLFFLSYAQSMCEILRPEKLKAWADASIKLPNNLRVTGSLQQLPEFAEAFHCSKGASMSASKYCHLW